MSGISIGSQSAASIVNVNDINVKIRRLSAHAVIPRYATELAAGFDIEAYIGDGEGDGSVNGCRDCVVIPPGERRLIATALSFGIPDGYELQLRPRSGLALNHGITLTNSPATIDADYTGEVRVILENRGDKPFIVADRDRICQGVIAPVYRAKFTEVDELSETDRGDGGFGHSGTRTEVSE